MPLISLSFLDVYGLEQSTSVRYLWFWIIKIGKHSIRETENAADVFCLFKLIIHLADQG